jgi:hypothetical protein
MRLATTQSPPSKPRLGLFRTPPPPPADASQVLLASGSECLFFNKDNFSTSDWFTDPAFDASAWERVRMPIGNSTTLVNTVINHVVPPGLRNYVRVNFTLSAAQLARARRFGVLLQVSTVTQSAILAINHNLIAPLASGTGLGARYWNAERHIDASFLALGSNLLTLAADRYLPDTSLLFIDVQLLVDTQIVSLSDVFSIVQPIPDDGGKWHRPGYVEANASGAVWTSVVMPVGHDDVAAYPRFGFDLGAGPVAARRVFSASADRLGLFGGFVVHVVHEDPFKVFVNGAEVLRVSNINATRLPLYFNGNATVDRLLAGSNVLALECTDFHAELGYCGIVLEGVPNATLWASLDPDHTTIAASTTSEQTADVSAPAPMEPFSLPLVIGVAVGATVFLIAGCALAIVFYRRATREPEQNDEKPTPAQNQYQRIAVRDASMVSVRASDSASAAQYQQISLSAVEPERKSSTELSGSGTSEMHHTYDAAPSEARQYDRISRAAPTTSPSEYAAPPLGTQTATMSQLVADADDVEVVSARFD